MPYAAEALKDQADGLTLADYSFSQGKFFFISPSHLDAYLQLLDSLKQQRGLTLLIGEQGIGKTTLLTKLISETPPRIKLVLCNPIHADFDSLLASINERLGLSVPEDTHARRLSALLNYLNAPAGKIDSLVLLIEDAQHLSATLFEELFKLILSEQNARCPLRVILSGSPRLTQALNERKILRVLPADTLFLHLNPLDSAATATYIYRQLGNAGNPVPETLFPAPVVVRIAHYANGLPQLINRLCEHALEIARKTGQFSLTVEMIDQAAGELEMDSRSAAPTARKPLGIYFAMLVVLAGLIAVLVGLPHLLKRLPHIWKSDMAASTIVSSSEAVPAVGQKQGSPPVAPPKATVPQVMTAVPAAVPPAEPRVEPPVSDARPTPTPPKPDNAGPAEAPRVVTATDPVDSIAVAPAAEPPATGIKPAAALEPTGDSPTRTSQRKQTASRPDRVSSAKPATNRRMRSLPPPQPVVPTFEVRKAPPPARPKADPANTRYRSAAYQKQTVRSVSRPETDSQDSTESNGWRIRK
ncbi:MAG: AAA family ATPase [Candidatus Competibacteraceae bacterium]